MIKKDFHGWTVEDALREIDCIVGDIRLNNSCEFIEFITGRGQIQKHLIRVLREYSLHPELKLGNDGVVVVIIQ